MGWRGQLTTSLLFNAYLNDNSDFFCFQIAIHLIIIAMRRISRILLLLLLLYFKFTLFIVVARRPTFHLLFLFFVFISVNSASRCIVCFKESSKCTWHRKKERETRAVAHHSQISIIFSSVSQLKWFYFWCNVLYIMAREMLKTVLR